MLIYENGQIRKSTPEEENKYQNQKSIVELRMDKLIEISTNCKQAINNGTQVKLSNGSSKQFSYTLEDQANISEMFTAVLVGATEYPYHANEEDCIIYNATDIITIYSTLTMLKTSHITYHNQLKAYVKSLDNAQDVLTVQYGQELTGEYLTKYNELMEKAQEQMQKILNNLKGE